MLSRNLEGVRPTGVRTPISEAFEPQIRIPSVSTPATDKIKEWAGDDWICSNKGARTQDLIGEKKEIASRIPRFTGRSDETRAYLASAGEEPTKFGRLAFLERNNRSVLRRERAVTIGR